jgi:hypothetical protein
LNHNGKKINEQEEDDLHSIYLAQKENYNRDTTITMMQMMKDTKFHPHPYKVTCDMHCCTSGSLPPLN